MKKNAAVTLVKNGTVLYPFTESDYEILQSLNCPLTHLTQDFLPLLKTYAKKAGVTVNLIDFDPIEADMFATKVSPRWKHGLTVTQNAVVLTYPKEQNEQTVDNLVNALKRWYRKHYVTFDVQIKRTAKKVIVTLKKTYGQPS
jgi:hypothetical protein